MDLSLVILHFLKIRFQVVKKGESYENQKEKAMKTFFIELLILLIGAYISFRTELSIDGMYHESMPLDPSKMPFEISISQLLLGAQSIGGARGFQV